MTLESLPSIYPIDKSTINKICSGQAIVSLSIAVKELIENSLDAEASNIQIILDEYGSEEIKVVDNGKGVENSNFSGLASKNHTSKIRNFEDLESVNTFGFRGEALSSLCALGRLEVTTRHLTADTGTRLIFDSHGSIIDSSITARQIGTTISVKNIFSTLPVRHKEFLRNIKREYGKTLATVQAYALLNSHCRSISCSNRIAGKPRAVLDVKCGTLRERISNTFGVKQLNNLLEIKEVDPGEDIKTEYRASSLSNQCVALSGYVSSCALAAGRSSPDRQFFYVNSRPIDSSKISRLVNEVYHQFNPHQYPFIILNVVSSGSLDVNVVPDKRQVMLEHENLVLATIKATLLFLYKTIPSTIPLQLGLSWKPKHTLTLDKAIVKEESTCILARLKAIAQGGQSKSDHHTPNAGPEEIYNGCASPLPKKPKLEIHQADNVDNNSPCYANVIVHSSINFENKTNETLSVITSASKNSSIDSASPLGVTCVEEGNFKKIKMPEGNLAGDHSSKTPFRVNDVSEVIDEGLSNDHKIKRRSVIINVSLKSIERSRKKNPTHQNVSKVKFFAKIVPEGNKHAEEELARELSQEAFNNMQVVGQFNRGFIITKLDSDVFIVDQHAAEEKTNFEYLSGKKMHQQRLAVPQPLHLSADKEEIFLERSDAVRFNGFDFILDMEAPVTQRISLTAIPVLLGTAFDRADLDQLLFLLSDAPPGHLCRATRVRDVLASKACRMSVMIGTILTISEMDRIVQRMARLVQPWNCPHGRPTIRHLLNLELIHTQL